MCPAKFLVKQGLAYHNIHHTGKYPFKCTICNRNYTHNTVYKQHMATHSNESLYTCSKCGLSFKRCASWMLHEKWHDNPKPFPCTQEGCDEAFQTLSLRCIHIRRAHTKEFLHVCPYCGQKFLMKSYLRNHLPKHTGEFQYNCQFCSSGFLQKQTYVFIFFFFN